MKKRRIKRYKRRRNMRSYNIIPIVALVIFVLFLPIIKSDFGTRLEAAMTAASKSMTNFKASTSQNELTMSDGLPSAPDSDRNIADSPPPAELLTPNVPSSGNISSINVTQGDEKSGTVYIQNKSGKDIDIPALLSAKLPVSLTKKGPQVLILHTHGSESYTPDAEYNYTPSDNDRTLDTNFNVVRVGDEITNILNERGIETVHVRDIFDSPSYNGAYTRSLNAISEQLKKHPSIKIVIDVHRDAMISKDGTKYKTVADIDGKTAAQLMFVSGSDAGGLVHDNWKKNLSFHAKLQEKMNSKYPGIMRPIIVRDQRFNQHVSVGSMLLEVGTSGNTLGEALYSAGLWANNLADMLKT